MWATRVCWSPCTNTQTHTHTRSVMWDSHLCEVTRDPPKQPVRCCSELVGDSWTCPTLPGWRAKSLSEHFQPKTPCTHLLSTPPITITTTTTTLKQSSRPLAVTDQHTSAGPSFREPRIASSNRWRVCVTPPEHGCESCRRQPRRSTNTISWRYI